MDDLVYGRVPKGLAENIAYRRNVVASCVKNEEMRQVVWSLCARDLLYWVNVFCWTYDPRKIQPDPSEIPFITWPFQDRAISEIVSILGIEDIGIEKSRDVGASWIILLILVHAWQFGSTMNSFLLVSRKEDLVDASGNPGSLFWKVDFLLKTQPPWMVPDFTRTSMHLLHNATGSVIDGSSTTEDTAKGDRRTAILLDEFAAVPLGHSMLSATADVTNCRIFNSTPKGSGNAFYDIMHPPFKTRKIRMHWTDHPEKAAGLYYLDCKPRSPWYDEQLVRRHPMEIAQELDIDYLGSDYQFFDETVLQKILTSLVIEPSCIGELDFDPLSCLPAGVHEVAGGRLSLWCHLDGDGQPPSDRHYVVGADISAGTGASNSCLSIGDCKTREKVGEFVASRVDPSDLAKYAIALCRFFRHDHNGALTPAFLVWEANGPGRIFGNTVIDNGYRNIFYRRNEGKLNRESSDYPGWYATRDTKMAMLGEYRRALNVGEFANRSRQAVKECQQYVYMVESNTVEHSRSRRGLDPSGAKDNHGDIVIADGLCWKGMKELPVKQEVMEQYGRFCFASRRQKRLEYAGVVAREWW